MVIARSLFLFSSSFLGTIFLLSFKAFFLLNLHLQMHLIINHNRAPDRWASEQMAPLKGSNWKWRVIWTNQEDGVSRRQSFYRNCNHIPQVPLVHFSPADELSWGWIQLFFFFDIWNVEKEEREALGPCQSNSLFFWQIQHQWQIAQFDINKVDRCRQSCFETAATKRCVGFFFHSTVCLITNKTTRCLKNATTFTMSSEC